MVDYEDQILRNRTASSDLRELKRKTEELKTKVDEMNKNLPSQAEAQIIVAKVPSVVPVRLPAGEVAPARTINLLAVEQAIRLEGGMIHVHFTSGKVERLNKEQSEAFEEEYEKIIVTYYRAYREVQQEEKEAEDACRQ